MSEPAPRDYEVSTVKPSRWTAFRGWVSPLAASLILAVIAAIIAYWIQVMQKQYEAYSKLMGQKILVAQIAHTRFESFAFSDYHERKWQLEGEKAETIDFKEAQRWMQKSEDLAIELAKSRKELYEILGLINSYFPNTEELKKLTHQVYRYNFFVIVKRPFELDAEQNKIWKERTAKEIETKIENEFTKPVDRLVTYLEAEINKEGGWTWLRGIWTWFQGRWTW